LPRVKRKTEFIFPAPHFFPFPNFPIFLFNFPAPFAEPYVCVNGSNASMRLSRRAVLDNCTSSAKLGQQGTTIAVFLK
jgi:hypothetical protein